MVCWKDFDFSKLAGIPFKNGKRNYDDNIFSFDIETTSIFYDGEKEFSFDKNIPVEKYTEFEKIGFCYIWQFSINYEVVFGRDLSEFSIFLKKLNTIIPDIKIIYVHNLAFEFQFLLNILHFDSVFARKTRHPIKAFCAEYNIEFRCSYILTNMALSKLSKAFNLEVEKMDGDLDYSLCRNSLTILSDKEIKYCENDCLVIYALISFFKEEYGHIAQIPLTQTGRVRKVLKKRYKNNNSYYRNLVKMLPTSFDEFKILTKCYSGGYTHANAIYSGRIIENVHSFDISSSYPTVMLSEKFPMTKFVNYKVNDIYNLDKKYCYIFDIEFTNLACTKANTFLSKSKAEKIINGTYDNGRLVMADYAEFFLTEQDLDIVIKSYSFDYNVIDSWIAFSEYLDETFVKYILELYANKTKLKDVPGFENEYARAKEFINALYGMCVTNVIRDEITFENGWGIEKLTKEKAEEKLLEQTKKRKTFLNYSWGVWVTAYARHNLWEVLLKVDENVLYTDTDSIKFVGDENFKFFDEYNQKIIKKLQKSCEYFGIDFEKTCPKTPAGKQKQIGIYDYEGKYDKFITLGAKKYCTEIGGKISATISGVNKKTGSDAIKNISDFVPGKVFSIEESGRKILTYNDEQSKIFVTDYQGNRQEINQKYGINLMPTTYTLGITSEYEDFIISKNMLYSSHLSILEGK